MIADSLHAAVKNSYRSEPPASNAIQTQMYFINGSSAIAISIIGCICVEYKNEIQPHVLPHASFLFSLSSY